jgi:hypothetical protein
MWSTPPRTVSWRLLTEHQEREDSARDLQLRLLYRLGPRDWRLERIRRCLELILRARSLDLNSRGRSPHASITHIEWLRPRWDKILAQPALWYNPRKNHDRRAASGLKPSANVVGGVCYPPTSLRYLRPNRPRGLIGFRFVNHELATVLV